MVDAGHLTLEKKIDVHEAVEHVAASSSIVIADKNGKIRLNLDIE